MRKNILLTMVALLLAANMCYGQEVTISQVNGNHQYKFYNKIQGRYVNNTVFDGKANNIGLYNRHFYYLMRKGTTVYLYSDKDFSKPIKQFKDVDPAKDDDYNIKDKGDIFYIKRDGNYEVWHVDGSFLLGGKYKSFNFNGSITKWDGSSLTTSFENLKKQNVVYRNDVTANNDIGLWDNKTQKWVSDKRWTFYFSRNKNHAESFEYDNAYYYFLANSSNNNPDNEMETFYIYSSDDFSTPVYSCSFKEYQNMYLPFREIFSQIGCFAAKHNGYYGLLDIHGNVIVDFKYTEIQWAYDNTFIRLFSGPNSSSKMPLTNIIPLTKNNHKRYKENKAQRNADKQKQELSRLSSFTVYATDYVRPRMTEWQQKGEFEKVSDYTRRVSGENRQRQIDKLTREAENNFIAENRKKINLRNTVTLETYDSENEVFSLNSSKFGRLLLPVPISEGPSFKQSFSNATFSNENYFVENDKFALASFDISVAGKTYHYSNNNALNYSQYQLNPDALDLPAINIVTGNSNTSMRKPKVQILSPQSGSQYQQGTVSFRINVVPGDGQQPLLYVEINGADAVELQPVEQSSKGARAVEGKLYEINLPTTPGKEVNLAFTARDEQNITSETQKVKLTYVGQVMKPKLILFAVGVGDYTSGDLTKLRYAAKDARDFTNTIENCNLSDYTQLVKHIYTDRQATRSNINKGLREVLNEANQGDVVMFYLSGHGVQDGSETYFMTINASSEAPSDEGISFADLKNNMRKLTERQVKVVAFMDACHAGAMVGAKGAAPKLTELDVQNVIEFYSSTTGEESAEDEKLQNGVFTAGLISGLNGAAANADGYITVNTLRTYLSDYVRNHNSRQTPVFKGVDAGDITLFHKK